MLEEEREKLDAGIHMWHIEDLRKALDNGLWKETLDSEDKMKVTNPVVGKEGMNEKGLRKGSGGIVNVRGSNINCLNH